jgi:sulfur carrier protein
VIRFNGCDEGYRDESIADMLSRHGIEVRGVAVAIDGDVVRRNEWSIVRVHDGAHVEVVTAVAGG